MKHGVAFRKLSRTSSHRMLMLRNLVTSLLEHEQIKTTLPKAKETARLAEKIITLGKKNTLDSQRSASAFLLNQSLVPKVFTTLAERYASRPGGYTRIHKFGNRPGDNAPHAVLELVDGPRDLKFEIVARSIGRAVLESRVKGGGKKTVEAGVSDLIVRDQDAEEGRGWLKEITRRNLRKALKFRGPEARIELGKKAADYLNELVATPKALDIVTERDVQRKKDERAQLEKMYEEPNEHNVDETNAIMIRRTHLNASAEGVGARTVGLQRGPTSGAGLGNSLVQGAWAPRNSAIGIASGALGNSRLRKPWLARKKLGFQPIESSRSQPSL